MKVESIRALNGDAMSTAQFVHNASDSREDIYTLEIDPESRFLANFVAVNPLFRMPNFPKEAFPDRSLVLLR